MTCIDLFWPYIYRGVWCWTSLSTIFRLYRDS